MPPFKLILSIVAILMILALAIFTASIPCSSPVKTKTTLSPIENYFVQVLPRGSIILHTEKTTIKTQPIYESAEFYACYFKLGEKYYICYTRSEQSNFTTIIEIDKNALDYVIDTGLVVE